MQGTLLGVKMKACIVVGGGGGGLLCDPAFEISKGKEISKVVQTCKHKYRLPGNHQWLARSSLVGWEKKQKQLMSASQV